MLEIHVLQADATNITFHDNAKLTLKAHEPKANIRREEMNKDSSKFKLKVFTTCNNGDEQPHIGNHILDEPKHVGVCCFDKHQSSSRDNSNSLAKDAAWGLCEQYLVSERCNLNVNCLARGHLLACAL